MAKTPDQAPNGHRWRHHVHRSKISPLTTAPTVKLHKMKPVTSDDTEARVTSSIQAW